MKLRNKITREINIVEVDEDYFKIYKDDGEFVCVVTFKGLNDGWEDYQEPKNHYFITQFGEVFDEVDAYVSETIDEMKQIGNYFKSKEEAEKAVEKLKAWKRLKDKGFEAFSSSICGDNFVINFKLTNHVDYSQSMDDFNSIFDSGGGCE